MLCEMRGRFLYEARPDLFPEGYLTDDEIGLWARHYEDQQRRQKQAQR